MISTEIRHSPRRPVAILRAMLSKIVLHASRDPTGTSDIA